MLTCIIIGNNQFTSQFTDTDSILDTSGLKSQQQKDPRVLYPTVHLCQSPRTDQRKAIYILSVPFLSMNKENFRLCSLYDEESRFIHFHNFTGRTVILSSRTKPELNSSKYLWSCGVVIPNGGSFVWKFLGRYINFTTLIFN